MGRDLKGWLVSLQQRRLRGDLSEVCKIRCLDGETLFVPSWLTLKTG